MELSTVLYAIVLILVLLYLTGYGQRPQKFPPGPLGHPIIGNVLQMGLFCHKVVLKLTEKYGDIVGIRFGSRWTVVLNNPDDIREAFGRAEFAGKSGFNPTVDETVEDYNKGLVMSFGKPWVEQRRFALRTLRDLGFGKRTMEGIIMEEVRELTEQLKSKHCDHPIKTNHMFNMAVFNVIWSIIAGERHEYEDPRLLNLMTLMEEFMKSNFEGPGIIFLLFPSLVEIRKLKHRFFGRKQKQFLAKAFEYFRETIREHEKTLEAGNPRDFIDTYLEEIKKTTDPTSSFYWKDETDDSNIITTLLDLFMAGSETTSSTLQWIFFILAQHMDVQEKVFQEIQGVVGNRDVLLADRPSLPYTEAMLSEVLRFGTLAPLGAPHSVSEDTTFRGYHIPKNSLVFANIYACHKSPKLWSEPENFKPERFLSADGKTVVRPKAWIPFGVGKRACMGESLARDEIFLFASNLIHNLRITMPSDEPPHTYQEHLGIAFVPEPHRILLHERNP